MHENIECLFRAVLIGSGATLFMDLVALTRNRLFDVALADYALVGRWLAYVSRGRFRHNPIAASPPVAGERFIGWTVHYVIGIAFAMMLLAVWGCAWSCHPTLTPALIVGIGSVAAPFLLMQPGMGLGVAASRTPRPAVARLRSLITHAIFGIGLYAAGVVTSGLSIHDPRGCEQLQSRQTYAISATLVPILPPPIKRH
jgi:hypothetical protein